MGLAIEGRRIYCSGSDTFAVFCFAVTHSLVPAALFQFKLELHIICYVEPFSDVSLVRCSCCRTMNMNCDIILRRLTWMYLRS